MYTTSKREASRLKYKAGFPSPRERRRAGFPPPRERRVECKETMDVAHKGMMDRLQGGDVRVRFKTVRLHL